VRGDRTPVSTALLVIAGIRAGEHIRRAVLSRMGEATWSAHAESAINQSRAEQIARHIGRAIAEADRRLAALGNDGGALGPGRNGHLAMND